VKKTADSTVLLLGTAICQEAFETERWRTKWRISGMAGRRDAGCHSLLAVNINLTYSKIVYFLLLHKDESVW